MSDAAFHHHYDQQSASASFGFTHSAPLTGFIALAAYLLMYSYYAHLLQYRRPFKSRTTTPKAKWFGDFFIQYMLIIDHYLTY